jgi:hypothetical protein
MKGILVLTIGSALAAAQVGYATTPAPGQHFDCSDGGDSSCAADDTGCVSNTANHLKCSSKIGKALAKAVKGVITCHGKQATMRFKGSSENGAGTSEENCEDNPGNSAKSKLDDTLTKLAASGICDPAQLTDAALEESVLFGTGPTSLDGQNGQVFCDSTSGAMIGDDDSGWVANNADNLKCELTVGKMVAKFVAYASKCHDKMNKLFFKAVDFDEEFCEDGIGLAKFNQQRDKLALLAICPPCLDSASIDALGASVESQVETANQLVYPCNLGP